ncbi:MAG: histidine--tRNA ligase [Paludibacteraceae bacterium]|nr:histidine--tRNA ligase [Paludibacteraceae bacterium]
MSQVSIPKGTRDFTPEQMSRRNYIFETIKSVFRLFGFQQIETPSLENLSTLMGKYGEEGDKLLFKILNSGDWAQHLTDEELLSRNSIRLANRVSDKGLRYDLTVPFARFVVQNREQIQFPFRRYQIQPVWRADRPQKGRYREFYQCDVDVVGSDSLVNELELIQIVEEVYKRLGIRVCLKINNRKVLAGIAEIIGQPDKIVDITVAIDKMDKIGLDKVNEELLSRGISQEGVTALQPILALTGSNEQKIESLRNVLANSETGLKGLDELEQIFGLCSEAGVELNTELDLTLARGLNYYTGAIFEVKALDVEIGSITGGGRYDNLTGIFGLQGVSGVGISFGADRIYDVLNQLNLYPDNMGDSTQVLLVSMGTEELKQCLKIAKLLRSSGINVEVYPEPAKMKKQMNYANNKHIPYVAIVGEQELIDGKVTLKNMLTGEQRVQPATEMVLF